MLNDVRFSVRILRKSPAFLITAVLSLALGTAAATTMFSAFRAVFLRPLPFHDPDRLVELNKSNADGRPANITVTDIEFWRQFSHSFEAIGSFGFYRPMTMLGPGEPANVVGRVVEKDFFPTLRATPALGRVFEPGDFENGHPRGILLSWKVWQEDLQRDPAVVGRRVMLDNDEYVVIGVMPPDFNYPTSSFTNVWVANRDGAIDPRTTARGVIARLKPGVTIDKARAELEAMRPALARNYPADQRGFHLEIDGIGARDLAHYRSAFYMLCAAVGMLVLIACLNVANLIIARSVSREGEFAVRSALGAARQRLVRQVLVESCVLAAMGGALGAALAYGGSRALIALLPAHYQIARLGETRVDLSVLGFATLLTAGTALLFGIGPAVVLSRFSLREFGRTTTQSGSRSRWRAGLVVAEIALSLTLLIGSGLLIRSFVTLASVNPGFRADHTLTMMVPVSTQLAKDKEKLKTRFTGLLAEASRVPGVLDAGLSTAIPMGTVNVTLLINLRDYPGQEVGIIFKSVSADYFNIMGIPLKRGRMLTARDDAAAPPAAVINEAFARKYWPNANPIGRQIGKGLTVVGVVGDVHNRMLSAPVEPEFYESYLQFTGPALGAMLVVRTQMEPAIMASALRKAIHEAYPDQPVSDVATMETRLHESLAAPRLYMSLLSVFASIALLLTAIGIYGVVSYAASQRTRELGIRMALGARRGDVLRLVMGRGMVLIMIGCIAGGAGAWVLRRYMQSLLYEIKASDPVAFVLAPVLLILIAGLASYVPAQRATTVDPNVALRDVG